jgi:hypothetical protein
MKRRASAITAAKTIAGAGILWRKANNVMGSNYEEGEIKKAVRKPPCCCLLQYVRRHEFRIEFEDCGDVAARFCVQNVVVSITG